MPAAVLENRVNARSEELALLLGAVPARLRSLAWTLVEVLDAVPREPGYDLAGLYAAVNDSERGWTVPWDQLAATIVRPLAQTCDLILVAHEGEAPARDIEDLRREAVLVIEALDCSAWRIYARDREVLEAIVDACGMTGFVPDEDEPILPGH